MVEVSRREPPWTADEFLLLLENLEKSDQDLFPIVGRSLGAIGTVRAGLVEHKKGNTQSTLLSALMRDLLRGREDFLQKLH